MCPDHTNERGERGGTGPTLTEWSQASGEVSMGESFGGTEYNAKFQGNCGKIGVEMKVLNWVKVNFTRGCGKNGL